MVKRTSKRLLFQWHITERCSLRCRHCYQEEQSIRDLPFDQLLLILDQFKGLLSRWRRLSNHHKGGHITVTGGEPFMREDLPELLHILAQHKKLFSFAILTNGHAIDSRVAKHLKTLSPRFVQVSIDGDRSVHDAIRGDGSHDKAVTSIKHLVAAQIPTLISFTAHKQNVHAFGQVAELGRRLGVTRIWADRFISMGRGAALADLALSPVDTWRFFIRMDKERTREKDKTIISMHRALQFLIAGGTPYHCTAGDTLIAVLPNGDLLPCRRMPIVVGNVSQSPLEELYLNTPLFRDLRDANRVSAECRMCNHATACRGGLRCLAYAVHGDPFRADPGCWVAQSTSRTSER